RADQGDGARSRNDRIRLGDVDLGRAHGGVAREGLHPRDVRVPVLEALPPVARARPRPATTRVDTLARVMQRKIEGTLVVAAALPLRPGWGIGGGVGAAATAARLRELTAGVPLVAYIATGVVWALLLPNGVLYPVFDSSNLERSWGGPTLAGAWAVHLAL